MSVVLLPAAHNDLLALQEHVLQRWGLDLWLRAEDEIFSKLADTDCGLIDGAVVPELAVVGIREYRILVTSHHRVVYRKLGDVTYVYAVLAHRQDFQTLLLRRMLQA